MALHSEASNLSPRTIRPYTDDGVLLAAFLARQGMPTAVASIRREHVEAFIAAELARTAPSSPATRYRSLQQLYLRSRVVRIIAKGRHEMVLPIGTKAHAPDLWLWLGEKGRTHAERHLLDGQG